jgi:4-hydroxybenzoate polyprenyltransferase
MNRFWTRLRLTLDMIKFEHSVFALPFALTGALLAWRDCGFQVAGLRWRFLWILVAMVAARSAAMAFNRILDADIDARNRRTAARHLPAGLLSTKFAWGFTATASLLFLWASRELGFRAGHSVRLFVRQTLHHVRAPYVGLLFGHRAGRRLDCHPRFA